MTPAKRPVIVGLDWDERNEQHIEEHIAAWLIEDMVEGGDYFAFSNPGDHPPKYRKFVGRTPAGIFVTAILREPAADNPGMWRPITGWMSTGMERDRYRTERDRRGKHRG